MSIEGSESQRASALLFNELATSRNGSRRENARRLKVACDQMERDKVRISVAEAVRRTGEGGPAYSTVSNKDSKLGEYVRLRIDEQGAAVIRQDPEYSLADTIRDPVLQAQIRDKEAVAKWVTKQNMGLRNLLKSLRPGIDIDEMLKGAKAPDNIPVVQNAERSLPSADVSSAILKLMTHLIGARNYSEFRGRLTINGKAVLDVTEYMALKRMTGMSDVEWGARFGASKESSN